MPVEMEVFEAIAQPKRRAILRLLAGGELSAGELASSFSVTQPAISQHLRVLREANLITARREGTRRLYSLQRDGLSDVHSFLADMLPARLQDLKKAAEEEEKENRNARGAQRN
jgi:DNA-binding transcriptional ArsR family regulator